MHGRPREYKHKLKEPKAAEAYKKKARGLFAAHLCSGVLRVSPAPLCARRICWGITRMEQPRLWSKRACVRRRQCDAADKRRAPPPTRQLVPSTHTHTQVDAIRQGTALVLKCRRAKRYDAAALMAAEKLLRVVPEVRRLCSVLCCVSV